MTDLCALASYQYELPHELIAQHPCEPRDSSRLMVVERASGSISEMVFRDLVDFLESGDRLVFNDTKVILARLYGKRAAGGKAELLLTERGEDGCWKVMAKPGKKLELGAKVHFSDRFSCEVIEVLSDGHRRVKFFYDGNFDQVLAMHGRIPLPPYIRGGADTAIDIVNYQTVFASEPGAVAAPTAGLHFTKGLLEQLQEKGVDQTKVTLHVGLGTFLPVQADNILEHQMHKERYVITPTAAEQLNHHSKSKRQICVGTTCCRALESSANYEGKFSPGRYETDIFIHPGYQFKAVHALITNFYLPGSTLLMLVSAFAGYDLVKEAYAKAIKERFRFYSYGDAMLII